MVASNRGKIMRAMATMGQADTSGDIIDLKRLARLPLILWCLVAVIAVALMDLRADPHHLVTSLGDADDAARVVQVRELISGASWFDRTLPQIGAPQPLVSHWSRIVDAPIAGLLFAARLVMPQDMVGIAVRAAWPLMVLQALLLAMGRWAETVQGRGAAIAIIALAAYAHSAMLQFAPGRIDHHNVMILGAVGGILMLSRAWVKAGEDTGGWLAGFLLGLGTAVGYEALPLSAGTLALASLIGAWTGRGTGALARAGLAFAATLAVALAATEPPERWTAMHCDALAGNLVLLAAGGAAGLVAMNKLGAKAGRVGRLALLVIGGAAGGAMYVWAEPKCLAGPFADVEPELLAIWLGVIQETHSLGLYASYNAASAWQFAIFAAIGTVAALRLWWLERDEGSTVLLAVVLASVALACWQIKFTPYATLLAAAPVAILIGRLEPGESVSAPAKGLLAFLVVNQHSILGAILAVMALTGDGGGAAAGATGHGSAQSAAPVGDMTRCQDTAAIQPLGELPHGLVAADVDLGSYIAALTPHRVVAAPYHRIGRSIVEMEAIRKGPADAAHARLTALGVDYVVTCKGMSTADLPASSLAARLQSGAVPDFLEPVDIAGPQRLAVWHVVQPWPTTGQQGE